MAQQPVRLYEVIVGNIGKVYEGPGRVSAIDHFNSYVKSSKSKYGRAAGEPVTLMRDGEIVREYTPEDSKL